MKNNFLIFVLAILIAIWSLTYSIAEEQFKFNVTEIEISNDGNLIIGSKGGKAETYDGHEITAKKFVYNKSKNILNVYGNIKFLDKNNNLLIFSDKATYFKNKEKIFTYGNSKAISQNNVITSKNFSLDIVENILVAENRVKFFYKKDGTKILSDKAIYQKINDIFFTFGNSKAINENNTITAEDFKFDRKQNVITANGQVKYVDKDNVSTIFSDKATYFKDKDIFTTQGNSKAINENNTITAEDFKFDRKQNVITANGQVKYVDKDNVSTIFSDKATYFKDKDIFTTQGNSKAINENNTITAEDFKFDRKQNVITANGQVKFIDENKNTRIYSEKAIYQKNNELIFTEGETSSVIKNKYNFFSRNIKYNTIKQELSSKEKSKIIDDNENEFFTSSFLYQIENNLLKATQVNVLSKVNKNKTDNFFQKVFLIS